MRGRSLLAGVVAAIALVAAGTSPAPARAQDASEALSDREWNQPGGGPTHTCSSTMAPIRSEPVVAWQWDLGGAAAAEPVCWGGIVYVAVAREKSRELIALRAATGEILGRSRLAPAGPVRVVVWQGTVVVAESDRMRGVVLRGTSLSTAWGPLKLSLRADPVLAQGLIFAATPDGLTVVDARTGRVSIRDVHLAGDTVPLVVTGYGEYELLTAGTRWYRTEKANYLVGQRTYLPKLTAEAIRSSVPRAIGSGVKVDSDALHAETWTAWYPADRTTRTDPGEPGLLFVSGARCFRIGDSVATYSALVSPTGSSATLICSRPAGHDGFVYGFTISDALIRVHGDGRYEVLVEQGMLPDGVRAGPATLAQGVLCFGNWAFDADTRRVLWSLPRINAATPAIPVADGRMVLVTQTRELVCLAESAAAASRDQGAPETQDGTAAAPPRAPGDLADGVLLADGSRVDGDVAVADGRAVRVTPEGGAPRDVPDADLSLAVAGGAVLRRGEEFGAFAAWRDAIEDEAARGYAALVRPAVSENMIETARGWILKARAFGLCDADAEALDRTLTGRSEHPNAEMKAQRFAKMESDLRDRIALRCEEASAWLADRGLRTAATAILAVGLRETSERPELFERAATLVPPEFPFQSADTRGAEWLRWAGEILPAGGAFVRADDDVRKRVSGQPVWAEGAIALRTRNLLLFSRCRDAAVVGACLRSGEGAVRALDALLADGRAAPVAGDADRLEVRLHANHAGYLAEKGPTGVSAMVWSAGYFSPAEHVSRFYVPDRSESEAARGRTLAKVIAHELTHHYVAARVAPGSRTTPDQPGFWVVEGIARFVEDQSVEMGRRGMRFDDTTVESLDLASQIDAQGALLLPLATFVDMSQAQFLGLSSTADVTVRTRNTLAAFRVSPLEVFYEEAGSLCFLVLNRRGTEGRAALLRYLRSYYAGTVAADGWKALGFPDAASMDLEFRAFLASLRR